MATELTRHVFFIGLGGIGMSALARHLLQQGHVVGGYDLTPSPLIGALIEEGMSVSHSQDPETFPVWVHQGTPEDLTVVWTPAVPVSSKVVHHFDARGIRRMKRAELLGSITLGKATLAVAGTHGKTTTSSWLAAMLEATPEGCYAFLGGIDAKTGSNHFSRPKAHWHIVEADEFDRSFHHLQPTHAGITNLDPDHLDVYGSMESFENAFHRFGQLVENTLILPYDLPWKEHRHGQRIERFACLQQGERIEQDLDHVAICSDASQEVEFHLQRKGVRPLSFRAVPSMPGMHNLANALLASALASHAEVDIDIIQDKVQTFGGVRRRMEVHLNHAKGVYIDDYAHHPSELKALIDTIRKQWPGRHVTMIFQPHLFSRTRDFGAQFAEVLSLVDRLFLLPIYPAREAPIPGVDAQWLFDNISSTHKHLSTSESIFGSLKACPVDVLVTAGAGDIDRLVPKALQHMQDRQN